MRKQVFYLAIAVVAVLFTACENVEIPESNSGNAIEFRSLVDKNGTVRASLVESTSDLTSFFVAAWLDGSPKTDPDFMESAVWRTADGWDYSPKKYYPTDGTKVSFYAYSPIKDVNMGNNAELAKVGSAVTFEYEVPNVQSENNTAVDLLVASVTDINSGDVAFVFNHALSGVTFTAKNNNPSTSELVFVVSGIEITALANEGVFEYPFSLTSWTPGNNLVTYFPGLPASGVSLLPGIEANLLSANDIMMVLPQETDATGNLINPDENGMPDDHTTASYVKVTFSLKDGSGAFIYKDFERYLPLPVNFTFNPGLLYNFQFQFEALNAITFEVTRIEDWATQDQPIPAP